MNFKYDELLPKITGKKQSLEQQPNRLHLASLFLNSWPTYIGSALNKLKRNDKLSHDCKNNSIPVTEKKERLCLLYLSIADFQCVYNRDNSWSYHGLLLRKKTISINYTQKLIRVRTKSESTKNSCNTLYNSFKCSFAAQYTPWNKTFLYHTHRTHLGCIIMCDFCSCPPTDCLSWRNNLKTSTILTISQKQL